MIELSPKQQETLDMYLKCGCVKSVTARALGVSRSCVRNTLKAIEYKGGAPWLAGVPIPDHLTMTNTTVHYKNGEVEQEWRRLMPSAQAIEEFVDGLCERVTGKGKAKARTPKKSDGDEVLFEIDIFDPHVGMYADEKETLDSNYDCDIAAARMVEAVEDLASRARRPKKCVLVFGGDCMHSDNRSNKTEHAGNVLDVDTRYQRVIRYLIAATRDCVQVAAQIAETVEIHIIKGNHSWHSEAWLAQVLNAYYSQCPNVNVVITQSPRSRVVWGNNLIVLAHGDRVPANKWPMVIAAEFAKEWGETKNRYLRLGHIHTQKTIAPVIIQEHSGIIVEFCPALCPIDSWHTESGYVGNQQGASAVEYHKSKGRITSLFHVV